MSESNNKPNHKNLKRILIPLKKQPIIINKLNKQSQTLSQQQ